MTDLPRLAAKGVGKAYGPRTALEPVNLELGRGLLVAVTGSNGAGKSTLLGRLAGTIRGSGRILLDGVPVGAATRGRIAYLPQRLRLPATATVADVLELYRGLAGPMADQVVLPDGFLPDAAQRIGHLSGGQAQRVALAAVLTGRPDLILLDEPLANLDDSGRDSTAQLIYAHADAGSLVMVANPTVTDLLGRLDQVVQMEQGQIRFSGPAADYLARLGTSIWVQSNGVAMPSLDSLPGALGTHARGEWTEVVCLKDQAALVLRGLAARNVPADHIRLSDRAGRAHMSSPTRAVR